MACSAYVFLIVATILPGQAVATTTSEGDCRIASAIQEDQDYGELSLLQLGARKFVTDVKANVTISDENELVKADVTMNEENKLVEHSLGDTHGADWTPPLLNKNKIFLVILEIVPLCGPLGIDRFYLGNFSLAIAKCAVCICTCFVGGIIWGTIDAIVVIVNALGRKRSLNTLGMAAVFKESQVEPAFALAVVAIIFQVFFCCCGFCGGRACLRRFMKSNPDSCVSDRSQVFALAN